MKYLITFESMEYINRYEDYLAEYDEYIYRKVEESGFIMIYYKVDENKASEIELYLKSVRFRGLNYFIRYSQSWPPESEGYLELMIVDKEFYKNNLDILIKNIKWEMHPNAKELKNLSLLMTHFSHVKNAKMANLNRPGYSLVKCITKLDGPYEFWPQKELEEPIIIPLIDNIKLQYYLYKYMGKT